MDSRLVGVGGSLACVPAIPRGGAFAVAEQVARKVGKGGDYGGSNSYGIKCKWRRYGGSDSYGATMARTPPSTR